MSGKPEENPWGGQVEVAATSSYQRVLVITVPREQVDTAYAQAVGDLSKLLRIKGSARGKCPQRLPDSI